MYQEIETNLSDVFPKGIRNIRHVRNLNSVIVIATTHDSFSKAEIAPMLKTLIDSTDLAPLIVTRQRLTDSERAEFNRLKDLDEDLAWSYFEDVISSEPDTVKTWAKD